MIQHITRGIILSDLMQELMNQCSPQAWRTNHHAQGVCRRLQQKWAGGVRTDPHFCARILNYWGGNQT
jgi:hypothetical protein